MALFRNFGVNRQNRLCGVHEYASAQFFDILELTKNCLFLDRKLISALKEAAVGHCLIWGLCKCCVKL
jgi:hypothetical protein